jgi:hypothetical protein
MDPCTPESLPEEPMPEPEPEVIEPEPAPDVEPVVSAAPPLAPVLLFEPDVGVEAELEPELVFAPEALPETFEPSVLDGPEQAATNETEMKSPRIEAAHMGGSMGVRDVACQTIRSAAEGSTRAAESFTCVE